MCSAPLARAVPSGSAFAPCLLKKPCRPPCWPSSASPRTRDRKSKASTSSSYLKTSNETVICWGPDTELRMKRRTVPAISERNHPGKVVSCPFVDPEIVGGLPAVMLSPAVGCVAPPSNCGNVHTSISTTADPLWSPSAVQRKIEQFHGTSTSAKTPGDKAGPLAPIIASIALGVAVLVPVGSAILKLRRHDH